VPERDGYIAGVPCWIDTSQPDPEAAVDFYRGVFGWDFEDSMPPGSEMKYFTARIRGGSVAAVSSIAPGAPQMATWNTYVWVDDADETASKVRDAGGQVVTDPFDVMDAGRMGVFSDPEGAIFCVWQAKEHKGAQIVNEHGSLNFNDLHTRDPESAKRFYGSVFGWGTLELDGGFTAWTLPGYAEYLERDNPDLRKNMADAGAPEGFADVVASLITLGDDQPDTPPHWGVTFAVDDADAAAEKATELGGRVIAPPMDAPWVRMTVLADPQGATFVASKFVPENKDVTMGANAGVSAA
jgi:predicted enzyme related to lactoylglutathione lyase